MTTPHNPGDDYAPQDPQDPQNPYVPPPPPSGQPQYGQPTPAQPQYGGPTPPPYGQPAYGPPGFPQYPAPPSTEPGKGLAITALVLSLLACTVVLAIPAIVLAIVVLVQSRDGRNHGKGLAIAALVISVISVIGTVAGGYALYDYAKDFKDPEDLEVGECITATGLSDASAESVSDIRVVSCSSEHDGEVLAVHRLTAEEVANSANDAVDVCTPAIDAAGKADLLTADLTVTALTDEDPEAGERAACVAYRTDGASLTGRLGG